MSIDFTEKKGGSVHIEPPLYLGRRDLFPMTKTLSSHEYCRIEEGVVYIILIFTDRDKTVKYELTKTTFDPKAPREALNRFFAEEWAVIPETEYAEKLRAAYVFVTQDFKL